MEVDISIPNADIYQGSHPEVMGCTSIESTTSHLSKTPRPMKTPTYTDGNNDIVDDCTIAELRSPDVIREGIPTNDSEKQVDEFGASSSRAPGNVGTEKKSTDGVAPEDEDRWLEWAKGQFWHAKSREKQLNFKDFKRVLSIRRVSSVFRILIL